MNGSNAVRRILHIDMDAFYASVEQRDDPALRGETTITITLTDARVGTDLLAVHEGLPRGVSPADNETGWLMALVKFATLVETGYSQNAADLSGHNPLRSDAAI